MSDLEGAFDCVIGIGANLGERAATLNEAARLISQLGTVLAVSAIYETEALGPPQPRFLNAALRLITCLLPRELLGSLLEIETKLGRERRERWGARVIDLDILWVCGVTSQSTELTLPHRELTRRCFALIPLLDVAPEAEDPQGISYRDHLRQLGPQGVRKHSERLLAPGPTE